MWIATVALWQAPLIVHALAEQQIDATFTEKLIEAGAWVVAREPRIYVHQLHRADAERIVGDLIGGGPSDGPR